VAGELRFYTVEEAARMLRLTPERVLEMVESGELEGLPTHDEERWKIPIRGGPAPPTPPPPAAAPTAPLPPQPPPPAPPDAEDEPAEDPAIPAEATGEARQPAALTTRDDAVTSRDLTSESGWVTTQQAARALGISARTVWWHIERGNLEAKPEGEGMERKWSISVDSLHALRDSRQAAAPSPRGGRGPLEATELAAGGPGNAIRELADRLVEEARRAEAARARLELAERAHSSIEAELAEERRRREEAERAREEAQRERDELRRRLDTLADHEPPRELPEGPASSASEVAPRPPETPAQGFGTDAAGVGSQRKASPRWWARRFPWRRS
jgi:helix-turn-helix protein